MKPLIRALWALTLFLFIAPSASASHIMGGELAYKCVGGMDYEFTLVIYRDCAGIQVPGQYPLTGVTNNCSNSINATLSLVDTAVVGSSCSGMVTSCDGGTYPGMEVYFYRDTITLPVDCDDWLFYHTSCCRNGSISNLVNPSATSFHFEASMNSLLAPCNDSPVFQELQAPFICDSVLFCMPNGVYDSDGDSIVYTMDAPLSGINTTAAYLPGFNANNPFPSATGHVFDPITGNHCSSPVGIGSWVVAYKIDEYRNGAWISSTRREVQLWVVPCTSADLTFTGTVTDPSGNQLTDGDVSLYEYGINNVSNTLISTVPIGASGDYTFATVPNGQYIVRAQPDTLTYPTLASTYHTSTHYWVYADVLGAVCDSTIVADIEAVAQSNLFGTGYLEGYLGDLGLRSSFGDPWMNQEVVLETWPGREHIRTVRSNTSGIYTFDNLPVGTYRIVVDHPGSPMVGYYTVTIGIGSSFTGLDYAGDAFGIYPYISTSINSAEAVSINLSPNPMVSGSTLTVSGIEHGQHSVEVLDIQGRVVATTAIAVSSEHTAVSIPSLPAGTYLLRVDNGAAMRLILE